MVDVALDRTSWSISERSVPCQGVEVMTVMVALVLVLGLGQSVSLGQVQVQYQATSGSERDGAS